MITDAAMEVHFNLRLLDRTAVSCLLPIIIQMSNRLWILS